VHSLQCVPLFRCHKAASGKQLSNGHKSSSDVQAARWENGALRTSLIVVFATVIVPSLPLPQPFIDAAVSYLVDCCFIIF
jgi:hypothetical protein